MVLKRYGKKQCLKHIIKSDCYCIQKLFKEIHNIVITFQEVTSSEKFTVDSFITLPDAMDCI